MFREKYKAAFGEIKADRTQIDKIFDIAENGTLKKKAKIVPFRYVGTLAAAIAIVIAVSIYPDFSGFLGTEQKELEPFGIVRYDSDTAWDNTVITSGTLDEQLNNTVAEQNVKQEEVKLRKSAVTTESAEVSHQEIVADSVQEEASTENVPMVAMAPSEESVPALEEVVEEKNTAMYVMKSSGGSSVPVTLVEETSCDLGEGKTAVISVYSKHNEIKAALDENGTDTGEYKLLIVSDEIAYAEKDGMLYKFTATGLTAEELEQFLNEKL